VGTFTILSYRNYSYFEIDASKVKTEIANHIKFIVPMLDLITEFRRNHRRHIHVFIKKEE